MLFDLPSGLRNGPLSLRFVEPSSPWCDAGGGRVSEDCAFVPTRLSLASHRFRLVAGNGILASGVVLRR